MKKRLSDQQQQRIADQRQRHRARAEETTVDSGDLFEGLVLAHYRQHLDVECDDGIIIRCSMRATAGTVVAGDRVVWQKDGDSGVIVAVQPRRSVLYRYHKYDGDKMIAANVDQLLIVVAIEPTRAFNILDRYLVLAELQYMQAGIVLNKTDLLDAEQLAALEEVLQVYRDLGYPIFYASARDNDGIETLRQNLIDKVSIFVGLSGVGKSSLVNRVIPETALRIGDLSDISREGRHTTTTALYVHLPEGGAVIDCPGVRELAFGALTPAQVLEGFVELRALANRCQFRDCHHKTDPGCAIQQALVDGTLNTDRFASYQNIIAQLG